MVRYAFSSTRDKTLLYKPPRSGPVTVRELRSAIMKEHKLSTQGRAACHLALVDAAAGHEYDDDEHLDVHSSVVCIRRPPKLLSAITGTGAVTDISEERGPCEKTALKPASSAIVHVQKRKTHEQHDLVAPSAKLLSFVRCPLSNTFLTDAVVTLCCASTYSQAALLGSVMKRSATCPGCGHMAPRWVPDKRMRAIAAKVERVATPPASSLPGTHQLAVQSQQPCAVRAVATKERAATTPNDTRFAMPADCDSSEGMSKGVPLDVASNSSSDTHSERVDDDLLDDPEPLSSIDGWHW